MVSDCVSTMAGLCFIHRLHYEREGRSFERYAPAIVMLKVRTCRESSCILSITTLLPCSAKVLIAPISPLHMSLAYTTINHIDIPEPLSSSSYTINSPFSNYHTSANMASKSTDPVLLALLLSILFLVMFQVSSIPYYHVATTSSRFPSGPDTTCNQTTSSLSTRSLNANSSLYSTLLIDTFSNPSNNSLGFYHGTSGEVTIGDFDDTHPGNELKVSTDNIDGKIRYSVVKAMANISSFVRDKSRGRLWRFPSVWRPVHPHCLQRLFQIHCLPPAAQQGL